MNKSQFVNTGGYRLRLERLQEMVTAYSIFNALGYIAGEKTIIFGCTVTGGNTGDGFVFLNGELLPFIGGATSERVRVIQENTSKEFQDGTNKVVHSRRYVTFGIGNGSVAWSEFTRAFSTKDITAALGGLATTEALTALTTRVTTLEKYAAPFAVSNGTMVFWRKPASEIPAGWQEVVDWRGRLAMGWNPDDATFDTMGENIGSKEASFNVSIPYNGWQFTAADKPTNGTGGRLVLGSGQSEQTEYLESLSIAKANRSVTTSANVLNPMRIVMYIEPIPQE